MLTTTENYCGLFDTKTFLKEIVGEVFGARGRGVNSLETSAMLGKHPKRTGKMRLITWLSEKLQKTY